MLWYVSRYVFQYVLVMYLGMYLGMYWYVVVCINTYWLVYLRNGGRRHRRGWPRTTKVVLVEVLRRVQVVARIRR